MEGRISILQRTGTHRQTDKDKETRERLVNLPFPFNQVRNNGEYIYIERVCVCVYICVCGIRWVRVTYHVLRLYVCCPLIQ